MRRISSCKEERKEVVKNKNNSEDSKDQQSAETGALAEETYELSIEEYKK